MNSRLAIGLVITAIAATAIARVAFSLVSGTPLSVPEIAEIAAAALVLVALAAIAIAHRVSAWNTRRRIRARVQDYSAESTESRIDDLESRLESRIESRIEDAVDDIRDSMDDTVKAAVGPAPDLFIPVIASLGPDQKTTVFYELPAEASREDAVQAAKDSVRARIAEGNPVPNPVVIVRDAFYAD